MISMVVSATLVAIASSNAEPDWGATFSMAQLESHLIAEARIAVVAGTSDAGTAAEALVKAARSSPRARAISVPDVLRAASGLADEAIVTKARPLAVDQVWIVRVFAAESKVTAVVTIYALDGRVVDAFSTLAAARGSPQAAVVATPSGSTQPPGEGPQASLASAATASPVASTAAAAHGGRSPREEFERRFIYTQEHYWVDFFARKVAKVDSDTYKGVQREPLEGAALYEYLGRNDLARTYRIKSVVRTTVAATSALLVVGGVVAFATRPHCPADVLHPGYEICAPVQDSRDTHLALSLSALGVAAIGSLYLAFSDSNPVEWDVRQKLVEDFNQKLADEVGVVLIDEERERKANYSLDAFAGPDAGGLLFRMEL